MGRTPEPSRRPFARLKLIRSPMLGWTAGTRLGLAWALSEDTTPLRDVLAVGEERVSPKLSACQERREEARGALESAGGRMVSPKPG